jgi:chorismate mutase
MEQLNLDDLRKSLDNIDGALILLLAERFKITQKVALYKKDNNLPASDKTREQSHLENIKELANSCGLDPVFAEKLLQLIIDEVVANHKKYLSENRTMIKS